MGSTTVALLAQHGFEVVASTGKTAEHAYLEDLGASRVVGRAFAPEDGRTLGPQLWGAVVDCVGGSALAEALRTTRYGGAVAASGLTGGNELTTTVYPFIVRGVALLGIDTVATPIERAPRPVGDHGDRVPDGPLRGDGRRRDRAGDLTEALAAGAATAPCADASSSTHTADAATADAAGGQLAEAA